MNSKIKLFAALLLAAPIANASIYPSVKPYDSICRVGYPCQVGAVHDLRIVNDTNINQTYTYFYSVVGQNGDAVKKSGTVTLEPGREFLQQHVENIGYMKFNMRGRKVLNATTQADGYEHATITKQGYADVN